MLRLRYCYAVWTLNTVQFLMKGSLMGPKP